VRSKKRIDLRLESAFSLVSIVKISKAKRFRFQRPDGELVEMEVPANWNQELVSKVVREDYFIHVVIASKAPAEADYGKVAVGNGPTGGYLIPGAAILSPDSPHGTDAKYVAYNLLVADILCRQSRTGNYEMAAPNCLAATSREHIFRQNVFYVITWNKYFGSPSTFSKDFALSLCHRGLVQPGSEQCPTELYADFEGNGETLRLKATPEIPGYVTEILGRLVPYCQNPFLRFFYLYQVVEHLMSIELDTKVTDVRTRLNAVATPSMVQVREILDKFQDATREKTRINCALLPPCPDTTISAETLLSALNALEPDTSFAEKIYRVRNTLFHDYKELHDKGEQISNLCQNLFACRPQI
jgi:hypothetical protein